MIAGLFLAATMLQTPPAFDAQARERVQAAIKDHLVDGDSAKWRWHPAAPVSGPVTYCGFVNAKNRMGGYNGFNPVWVTGSWVGDRFAPSAVEFAEGPYLDGSAARNCMASGYKMDVMPPE